MTTLRQAEQALMNREPFIAGNLSARISGGVYEVFSYFELIGASTPFTPTEFAEVYASTYNFSNTTSKHLNIVKRAWGVN